LDNINKILIISLRKLDFLVLINYLKLLVNAIKKIKTLQHKQRSSLCIVKFWQFCNEYKVKFFHTKQFLINFTFVRRRQHMRMWRPLKS